MQMAVIEAARNLSNVANAGSEEFDHEASEKRFTPVVYHLKEWVQGNHRVRRNEDDDKGGTMRLGAYNATLNPESLVAKIYGSTAIEERHRHRYEVDIQFRQQLEEKGLIFSGMSPDGRLPEIVEVKDHPWFIGVQFHPELKSQAIRTASFVPRFCPRCQRNEPFGLTNNGGPYGQRILDRPQSDQ